MFPVGHLHQARGPRARAARAGLAVADKPDSHEICFVPDGDAAGFVERRARRTRPTARSSIPAAACSARHRGVHRLTVGQRKGLGLATGRRCTCFASTPPNRASSSAPRGARRPRTDAPRGVNWIAGEPPAESRSPDRRASATATSTPPPPSPPTPAAGAHVTFDGRRWRSRQARLWSSMTARKWSAAAGSNEPVRTRRTLSARVSAEVQTLQA